MSVAPRCVDRLSVGGLRLCVISGSFCSLLRPVLQRALWVQPRVLPCILCITRWCSNISWRCSVCCVSLRAVFSVRLFAAVYDSPRVKHCVAVRVAVRVAAHDPNPTSRSACNCLHRTLCAYTGRNLSSVLQHGLPSCSGRRGYPSHTICPPLCGPMDPRCLGILGLLPALSHSPLVTYQSLSLTTRKRAF